MIVFMYTKYVFDKTNNYIYICQWSILHTILLHVIIYMWNAYILFCSNLRGELVLVKHLRSRILAIHGILDSTNSPRKLWRRASTRTCGPRIVCMLGLFPFSQGKTLCRTPSRKLRWPIKMIKNFTHGSLSNLMTYGCTGLHFTVEEEIDIAK